MRVDGWITRRLIVGWGVELTIGSLYTIRDIRNHNLSVPALCCAVLCHAPNQEDLQRLYSVLHATFEPTPSITVLRKSLVGCIGYRRGGERLGA
jgi:hypothetical protein